MKNKLAITLVVLMVIALPSMAFASPWMDKTTYGDKTVGKLTFGLKNTLLGWTELFKQPMDHAKDGKSFLAGMGHGILNTVTYTVGGVLHVVTFPFTSIDIPIPNDGVKL